MDQNEQYNIIIDEVVERLKLIEGGGVDYIALGPKPSIEFLFEIIKECTLCPLHKKRLTTSMINWGREGFRTELAFVLDAELSEESKERELLTKMIEAMGVRLEDTYITNVIKCIPKEPDLDNEEALHECRGFLSRELEYVSPSVVVTLGEEATKALVETPLPFNSIRGRFQNPTSHKKKPGSAVFQVLPTHPLDMLIGDKEKKKESWNDLKKVMARLKLKAAK